MMPPVWAGCLRVLLPPRLRFAVMRDTGTTFENLEARLGRRAALRWLRSQVRGAVGPSLRYRLESGAASMRHIGCAVTSLGADVRQAVRGAVHQPGFGVAVVLTLGLGIGGTVAIFSVVDAVFVAPAAVSGRRTACSGLGVERHARISRRWPVAGQFPRLGSAQRGVRRHCGVVAGDRDIQVRQPRRTGRGSSCFWRFLSPSRHRAASRSPALARRCGRLVVRQQRQSLRR